MGSKDGVDGHEGHLHLQRRTCSGCVCPFQQFLQKEKKSLNFTC